MNWKLIFLIVSMFLSFSTGALTSLEAARQEEFVDYSTLTYDGYMSMTTQKRRAIFDDVTPSQRASLVREHINRCRTLNEKKLDHEQAAAIDEALRDLITEEMYTFPLTPAQEKKRDSWKRRVEGIFSGNELAQFFSLDTPCK